MNFETVKTNIRLHLEDPLTDAQVEELTNNELEVEEDEEFPDEDEEESE